MDIITAKEFNLENEVHVVKAYYTIIYSQLHSLYYRIASYLHRVPIFAFFVRQNNLMKINSYERTRIDRTTFEVVLSIS